MVKQIDLTGQTFNQLTAIKIAYIKNRKPYWEWKCDCDNIKVIDIYSVISGSIKSCGCLRSKIMSQKTSKHNMSKTRIFRIWSLMKDRCYNSKSTQYINWGGRGIKVCDEWLGENGFINFYNWAMANGYIEEQLPNGRNKLELDRIDNDGNYEPSNCRWATHKQQQNNKRNNRLITYNGETRNITEWTEFMRFPKYLLKNRLDYGWSIEKALTTPVKKYKN